MDYVKLGSILGEIMAQVQAQKHRGRPLKEDSADRKESILVAALKLFSERGFLETSFAMIAAEIGISQPAIHHYFANKDELILAVLQEIVRQNRDLIESKAKAEDDALTALHKHCQGNLDWALKNPSQAQIVILLYYYSISDEYFAKLYDVIQLKGQERIYAVLAAGQREGLWSYSQVELKEMSMTLHCFLIGIIINILSTQKVRGPQVKKYFDHQWELLVSLLLSKKNKK